MSDVGTLRRSGNSASPETYHAPSSTMVAYDCNACALRGAKLIIAANVLLGVLKSGVGIVASSAALAADGVQSLACAVVGVLVLVSMKVRRLPANGRFPYGYGKAEFLVSVVSLTFLLGLGLFMFVSSGLLLLSDRNTAPELIALPVSLVSVLANYIMLDYSLCAANRIRSPAMFANAQQSRADMLSSCVVVLAIMLSQLDPRLAFFDALGTMVVAVMIIVDSSRAWWGDMRILVDQAVSSEMVSVIENIAVEVPRVRVATLISARRTGHGVMVDLAVETTPQTTVGDAQRLAVEIKRRLRRELGWITGVIIYPRPATRRG